MAANETFPSQGDDSHEGANLGSEQELTLESLIAQAQEAGLNENEIDELLAEFAQNSGNKKG